MAQIPLRPPRDANVFVVPLPLTNETQRSRRSVRKIAFQYVAYVSLLQCFPFIFAGIVVELLFFLCHFSFSTSECYFLLLLLFNIYIYVAFLYCRARLNRKNVEVPIDFCIYERTSQYITAYIQYTLTQHTCQAQKKRLNNWTLYMCVCVSGTYKKETTYCVPPKKISFVIHNFTFFPIFSDNVWFLFLNNNNNKECIGIQSRLKETARE